MKVAFKLINYHQQFQNATAQMSGFPLEWQT